MLRKIYCCEKCGILSERCSRFSPMVSCGLVQCSYVIYLPRQYCLPSMVYGSEIWYVSDSNLRSFDIAWNNALRKIFNGFWRESVKPLLFYCKCLPISFMANLNKLLFWKKLMVFDNPIVRWLATRRKDSMYALACKLNIDCDFLSSFIQNPKFFPKSSVSKLTLPVCLQQLLATDPANVPSNMFLHARSRRLFELLFLSCEQKFLAKMVNEHLLQRLKSQ